MTWTNIQKGAGVHVSSNTAITLTLPSGSTAHNVVVCTIGIGFTGSGSSYFTTTPSGFTLWKINSAANGHQEEIWVNTNVGAGLTSFAFSGGASAHAISGEASEFHTSILNAVFALSDSGIGSGSGGTSMSCAFAGTSNKGDLLILGCNMTQSTGTTTFTAPGSWTAAGGDGATSAAFHSFQAYRLAANADGTVSATSSATITNYSTAGIAISASAPPAVIQASNPPQVEDLRATQLPAVILAPMTRVRGPVVQGPAPPAEEVAAPKAQIVGVHAAGSQVLGTATMAAVSQLNALVTLEATVAMTAAAALQLLATLEAPVTMAASTGLTVFSAQEAPVTLAAHATLSMVEEQPSIASMTAAAGVAVVETLPTIVTMAGTTVLGLDAGQGAPVTIAINSSFTAPGTGAAGVTLAAATAFTMAEELAAPVTMAAAAVFTNRVTQLAVVTMAAQSALTVLVTQLATVNMAAQSSLLTGAQGVSATLAITSQFTPNATQGAIGISMAAVSGLSPLVTQEAIVSMAAASGLSPVEALLATVVMAATSGLNTGAQGIAATLAITSVFTPGGGAGAAGVPMSAASALTAPASIGGNPLLGASSGFGPTPTLAATAVMACAAVLTAFGTVIVPGPSLQAARGIAAVLGDANQATVGSGDAGGAGVGGDANQALVSAGVPKGSGVGGDANQATVTGPVKGSGVAGDRVAATVTGPVKGSGVSGDASAAGVTGMPGGATVTGDGSTAGVS